MKSVAMICEPDAAVRLRRIAKLWPRVIAAQQSNILAEAYQAAVFTTPTDGTQFRIQWDNNAMAPIDEFRLKELIKCWPAMRPTTQKDTLEHVEAVTGAAFATAE